MKTLKIDKSFLIIALTALVVFAVGCGSTQTTGTAEDEFNDESVRGLDKITQQVINDLDSQISLYNEVANQPEYTDEAAERRNNLHIIVSAYEIGLKEALENGEYEQKSIAAEALGVLNSQSQLKEIVPKLLELVRKGNNDEDLRYRALVGLMLADKALRYYGLDDNGAPTPARDEMLYAIAYNLSNPEYDLIRTTAVITLGNALNKDEKKDLQNAIILRLSEETDVYTKAWVIYSLSQIGSTDGLDAIASLSMNDEDPNIRTEAVVAIGQSMRKEYIPLLLKKLEDKESSIRRKAIMWLTGYRNIDDKRLEIASAIQPLLNDSDYKVRTSAALALGDLGEKFVVQRLIAKLGDRELKVQMAAVESLGKLADESAIEPLIKAMASREEDMRDRCRKALIIITGADWGESVLEWQQWFDQGMPPVSPENKANAKSNKDTQTNSN